MNIYTPYTYLIGWSSLNLYYYGVRFARNCHPDEFWSSYFTSSKYVQKARQQYGDPDIIQIRKTFTDQQSARDWEHKVLRRMKVTESNVWLNRSYGKSPPGGGMLGINHSEEAKQKISKGMSGRVFSTAHKDNLSASLSGRKLSESHIAKMKNSLTGRKASDEHRRKISEAIKAKWAARKEV